MKGYPRGEVGLDHTGDHIHRRSLSGKDQVNASCPRHLGQPGDGVLHLPGRDEHQISQLVNDDDYIWQGLDRVALSGFREAGLLMLPQRRNLFVIRVNIS